MLFVNRIIISIQIYLDSASGICRAMVKPIMNVKLDPGGGKQV